MKKLKAIFNFYQAQNSYLLWLLILLAFFLTVAFGLVHHYMVCGQWFDWGAIVHHEVIIVAVIALGIGLLSSAILRRWLDEK